MGRWRRPVGWINLAVVLVLDVAVMEEEEMLVAVELEVAV